MEWIDGWREQIEEELSANFFLYFFDLLALHPDKHFAPGLLSREMKKPCPDDREDPSLPTWDQKGSQVEGE